MIKITEIIWKKNNSFCKLFFYNLHEKIVKWFAIFFLFFKYYKESEIVIDQNNIWSFGMNGIGKTWNFHDLYKSWCACRWRVIKLEISCYKNLDGENIFLSLLFHNTFCWNVI